MRIFAAVAALLLTACGRSDYAGRWSGVYTAITDSKTQGGAGAMSIEVASDGQLGGTLSNRASGESFSVVGRIDASGAFEATFVSGSSVSRAEGKASVSAGHLTGTSKTYVGGIKLGSLSFDLLRI